MSDEFDKPSWSEVDKKKDRGQYKTLDRKSKNKTARDQSKAKKELQDLFVPKSNPEQKKALNALSKQKGKDFEDHAKAFVDQFGFPKNLTDLFVFCDTDEDALMQKLSKWIVDISDMWPKPTKDLYVSKLKIQKMMLDDPQTHQSIQETIDHLLS